MALDDRQRPLLFIARPGSATRASLASRARPRWLPVATEGAQVIDAAVQLFGGCVVMVRRWSACTARSARCASTKGGATEVQQLIIGRDLIKEAS
jgi:acyl-CoA dehydrogenase